MRKIVALIACVMMIVTLFGCTSNEVTKKTLPRNLCYRLTSRGYGLLLALIQEILPWKLLSKMETSR